MPGGELEVLGALPRGVRRGNEYPLETIRRGRLEVPGERGGTFALIMKERLTCQRKY